MTTFDLDAFYVFQELHHSVGTLCVMTDATSRSLAEMSRWKFESKDEMKHLGGTLIQMRGKFVELMVLGTSKMVEDFFNNLAEYRKQPIKIWDSSYDSCRFVREVRRIRHLGNVIKHNNSLISSGKGQSAKALIEEYGMRDETPVSWIDLFRGPEDEAILSQIFMANEFCHDVMRLLALPFARQSSCSTDAIREFMLNTYVRVIPGHPEGRG